MADLQRRVTKSGEVRWDVRYRDDARQQRKRSFERKLDAQRFARSVETDLLRGDWIDPRRGQELFEVWAAMWMETLASRKPKTRESYESIVHCHLLPRFAATPIAAIDYPCVLAFVAGLQRPGLGAGTVRNIRDVLRLVLGLAVRSGALKVNPVIDVEVSRPNRSEMIFLDPDQTEGFAGRDEGGVDVGEAVDACLWRGSGPVVIEESASEPAGDERKHRRRVGQACRVGGPAEETGEANRGDGVVEVRVASVGGRPVDEHPCPIGPAAPVAGREVAVRATRSPLVSAWQEASASTSAYAASHEASMPTAAQNEPSARVAVGDQSRADRSSRTSTVASSAAASSRGA